MRSLGFRGYLKGSWELVTTVISRYKSEVKVPLLRLRAITTANITRLVGVGG